MLESLKEHIPGTEEYNEKRNQQEIALSVMREWERGEQVANQIKTRIEENMDFYKGESYQQINPAHSEGDMRIVTNLGSTVIDLIAFIISNSPPNIQVLPNSANKLDQVEAAMLEEQIKKAFDDAKFKVKFRDSAYMAFFAGYVDWFPFWNTYKEFGKDKKHFDFSVLHPIISRAIFETTDFTKVESFITTKRATPEWVFDTYGITAHPDYENPFMDREIYGPGIEDGKVTIFKKYTKDKIVHIIDLRVVKEEDNIFGFAPLIRTKNKYLPNEATGLDEFTRLKPVAQEINALISATSEIARDLGYPGLIEYNNALNGQHLPKIRGNKISVKKRDSGPGLEFLLNKAQVEPMLKQIQLLIELFHFIALMPKAAAGIFEGSVTSGFQAKLAMQPATLNTDNKKLDYEESIKRLAQCALYLIYKKDPKAFEFKLDNGEDAKIEDPWEAQMEVKWPENLPVDISREIQNLILGIQNSLTSVTQSVDKYNYLMGMGSPEDTKDYLVQEAEAAEINPDRALKVAQVKKTLSDMQMALEQMQQKVAGGPMDELSSRQEEFRNAQNSNNAAKSVTSLLPEEQKSAPETSREAVNEASTGGAVTPTI